jgi:hypothetical protein
MKVSDLTEPERKIWQATVAGILVDLRVGDPQLDSPEQWAKWGRERAIRAKVIVALLLGDGEAASMAVRGVRLQGARITGELNLEATTLRCPLALLDCSFASAINLEEAMALSVRLSGSHVPTVHARQLRTRGDLQLDQGFSVSGEVRLLGAHIGGQLNCRGAQFSNPDGLALNLEGATVSGPLLMKPALLEGTLNLTAAKTSGYHDTPARWPRKIRLAGFVYDAIEGASAKERLDWLRRNEYGYSPQIYEQLAAVYRHSGHDEDARRVLIAKQRRRSSEGNFADKMWGLLLDSMVGYGYRTWLAGLWLVGLLVLGTYLFGYVYQSDLTPANKTNVQPPFQPFLYTLDLLLPVASLHLRDAWVAHGAAQGWSVFFIIMGWVLATAIVLSLTGLLKRD